MTVNVDKTKSMLFCSNRMTAQPPVFYYGDVALENKSFVYLGVEIASDGQWHLVKERCVRQASKAL